jgi:2-(1,2-epoxy-1,2-dihydrophenyl)acetyl-CoA isomerase
MTVLVRVTDDAGVRTLTLNRPEARNALSTALLVALRDALTAAVADAAVRAVILTGAGTAFCAGADVKEWAETAASDTADRADEWITNAHALIVETAEAAKPTIALLNGAAVGAGLDLALACDFRFAAHDARFACAYTWLGYNPDAGGTWLLPRLVGLEAAKRFVFTGAFWDAETAQRHGLISEVHPRDALVAATDAFAATLADGPTVAIGHAKRLLADSARRSLADQLEAERIAGEACAVTDDHREALAAASARRTPIFRGR